MDKQDKTFISEIQSDLNKERFLTLLSKNKGLIIAIVVIVIIAIVGLVSYNSYTTKKAEKNSIIFDAAVQSLSQADYDSALKSLNTLSLKGNNGYKFLAELESANIYITQKKYDKALVNLKNISNINLPSQYHEFAQYLIYKIRLDQDSDVKKLSEDLKKTVAKKGIFYYADLELYLVTLLELKKYDEVIQNADIIINSDKISSGIKERAKNIKSYALGYVKNN